MSWEELKETLAKRLAPMTEKDKVWQRIDWVYGTQFHDAISCVKVR